MEMTIISHDTVHGLAEILFEHSGPDGELVTVQQTYNLIDTIPGSRSVFSEMNLAFDESYQQLAIERLAHRIQAQIESGVLQNPPAVAEPIYEAPPEPEAPAEEEGE